MNQETRERGELVAPINEVMPQVEREITDEVTEREPEMAEYAMDMGGAISTDNIRGISINPLSSGYMVKVGCQSVAVESTERLIDMLNKYLTDPADFERKWYSKNVRNRLENII
jgi:hypothetical protein